MMRANKYMFLWTRDSCRDFTTLQGA